MASGKVTMYLNSEFGMGVVKIEATRFEVEVRPFAQYPSGVYVEFLPKGKRKMRTLVQGYKPSLLVLDGWGHPDPDSAFMPPVERGNGVSVQHGRYSACDPRWQGDFDAKMSAYLETPNVYVLHDFRGHNANETPASRAFRFAQAEPEYTPAQAARLRHHRRASRQARASVRGLQRGERGRAHQRVRGGHAHRRGDEPRSLPRRSGHALRRTSVLLREHGRQQREARSRGEVVMVTEDEYGGIGKETERKVMAWCRANAPEHESATSLAEEAAVVFDLYLDRTNYTIPERVFEISAEYIE